MFAAVTDARAQLSSCAHCETSVMAQRNGFEPLKLWASQFSAGAKARAVEANNASVRILIPHFPVGMQLVDGISPPGQTRGHGTVVGRQLVVVRSRGLAQGVCLSLVIVRTPDRAEN